MTTTTLCHPDETRPLSLAECAAVQGYPQDWAFTGTPEQKFRQVGNGVPPALGRAAGLPVTGLLDEGLADDGAERFRFVDLARPTRMSPRRNPVRRKAFTA